ncbi:hypothetical protein DFH09DRAFT_1100068 [Mycena vulgaris]|nr:hypothetical protein DFH09DRAFT_1100068 [Mycena vulgaris]
MRRLHGRLLISESFSGGGLVHDGTSRRWPGAGSSQIVRDGCTCARAHATAGSKICRDGRIRIAAVGSYGENKRARRTALCANSRPRKNRFEVCIEKSIGTGLKKKHGKDEAQQV